MKIGAKYKIAKRLGAEVFEKTQSPKFALAMQKKSRAYRPRPKSNYGIQLLEKQKVRYTYILSEKQFAKYVNKVIEKNPSSPAEMLYQLLERRLDNVVLRAGFAKSRPLARQLVSHGHIYVNGKKVTIPSYEVKAKDVISIRPSSKEKPLFATLDEDLKDHNSPSWINFDKTKKEASLKGDPTYSPAENHFDLLPVLQFYKR